MLPLDSTYLIQPQTARKTYLFPDSDSSKGPKRSTQNIFSIKEFFTMNTPKCLWDGFDRLQRCITSKPNSIIFVGTMNTISTFFTDPLFTSMNPKSRLKSSKFYFYALILPLIFSQETFIPLWSCSAFQISQNDLKHE